MLVECLAIVVVILLLSFVFLRSGRKDYALTTLPLMLLPTVHVITSLLLASPLNGAFSLDTGGITVAIDATSLVVSCVLLGLFSHQITSKKARNFYLVISILFVVVLTWVLIANAIGQATA